MLSWIKLSGTAHTLKDLEKTLPSVGSINSMQVKEYIQSMLDENELTVEKIGASNWYWSFPSIELARRQSVLDSVRGDRDRVLSAVAEMRQRLEEARTSSCIENAEERKILILAMADAVAVVHDLRADLDKYSGSDPVELDSMRSKIERAKGEAELFTEQIENMVLWLKSTICIDRGTLVALQKEWYGDEFDEDQQGLRELI
jgi:hypothetical protein